MSDRYSPWTAPNPLHGVAPLTPAMQARIRVLDALETIEKFDTDRDFILKARSRYCEITSTPVPANDAPTEPRFMRMETK